MITIDFDRMADHATFCGRRVHGVDAFFDMCRFLTDEGWADVPVTGVDERGVRCWITRSLHGCARRYRPNEADLAAKKARQEAARLAA